MAEFPSYFYPSHRQTSTLRGTWGTGRRSPPTRTASIQGPRERSPICEADRGRV